MTPRTWYLDRGSSKRGKQFRPHFSRILIHYIPDSHSPDWGTFEICFGPVTSWQVPDFFWFMGTHTSKVPRTSNFRTHSFLCFDKKEASSNLIPYFLLLESILAHEDVLWAILKHFHIRRPEPAAWICLHVDDRRRTVLYAFARGKNSWCWTSCSYW